MLLPLLLKIFIDATTAFSCASVQPLLQLCTALFPFVILMLAPKLLIFDAAYDNHSLVGVSGVL
jgi:hypothetical protein